MYILEGENNPTLLAAYREHSGGAFAPSPQSVTVTSIPIAFWAKSAAV
jgi:hypothetical protein